jgi:hypothetical protein
MMISCNVPFLENRGELDQEGRDLGPEQNENAAEGQTADYPPERDDGGAIVQPTELFIPLTILNPKEYALNNHPITSGVPIPASLNLIDLENVHLVDETGQAIPVQMTPLARWGGGPEDTAKPIRWLLLDFQANIPAGGSVIYRLEEGEGDEVNYPQLTIDESEQGITINTGAAEFFISGTSGQLSGPGMTEPFYGRAVGVDGSVYSISMTGPVEISIALEGPMRVSVQVKGSYQAADNVFLDYTSRYWFYAGLPVVRLFHTVENNTLCPLSEEGQLLCHNINSQGSVSFADLSLILPAGPGDSETFVTEGDGGRYSGSLEGNVAIYQDSSGTDYWNMYPTMVDWEGNLLDTSPRMQTYVNFRGYTVTADGMEVGDGDKAEGWLQYSKETGVWSVGVKDFWQNFPKALRIGEGGNIEIGLFPIEFGPEEYAFSLRAGEHKTHEIVMAYGEESEPGRYLVTPFARAPYEWYVVSEGFGFTAFPNWEDWEEHENYIVYQLDTSPARGSMWDNLSPNLIAAIEEKDFYGIFDYGDWPLDYEGYEVAPLNPKYDNDYGMWLQFARGGDPRWFDLADAADRHFADVDILHNLHSPRHWGDGISFGHSEHDEEGFLNPHRNINSGHPDTVYGVKGMFLHYYLTGYEKSWESALELAGAVRWRTQNDGFLCYFFPEGECNGEGYALDYAEGLYEAMVRPAANDISINVAAFRATGDERFLKAADAMVDWGRASDQVYLNGPNGDEYYIKPWTLNMYLRALADYIEARAEYGLPDEYGAIDSYLLYADFLLEHAWIDLEPIESGDRAAYPYEWWFDDRQGDLSDEWSSGNNMPSIVNWLLLGADAQAYAYYLSGEEEYLNRAEVLFRTGSHDPWFEGGPLHYGESKETVSSITFGHVFLYFWARK